MSRTLLVGLAAAATAVYLGACASPSSPSVDEGPAGVSRTIVEHSASETATPRVTGIVASGLDTPWGVAFLPGGSALVTERNTGRIVEITDGEVREVGRVGETLAQGESGLLGIAVSPTFDTDRFVYLYVTTGSDNRVLRAVFDGTTLAEPEVILDGIPAGRIHDGGRMIFGPDGMLYVATGEAGRRELAQDPNSLGGKILRITGDGEPAPGNPDPASPVYSLGHRNVQGLAFDDRGRLWASEFGQNDVDELNLVTAGANYGWPVVEGAGGSDEFVDPVLTWPVSQASPSGLAWFEGSLWMATLRGERLWRIDVQDTDVQDTDVQGTAATATDFFVGEYGRLRTVVAAPDGSLWLTTSNRDGRGSPAGDDDRILRIEIS
ncbi:MULTISPECIES: PQQ-dependent sugar dehydrogenase [Rhodococcus]|uniref:PQQ-dependent sugar dehydrogenase n=1 Tax=Rhodococcus TaxID=1827 RepID=UPI000750EED9|nr:MULTISPECIES: PQQ-dependent sugar dehydrogenase [Rhodococcus]MCB8910310.1 PQQ-dependent sugar dehydrogenase [Rhodococcus rhodochrous]MDC3727204.1 PQQ-dependent sugar dehydrogenase [Rhodococcus sp. Rp3]MDO1485732.1 PQQ-dependent sugar dehydrogenase [Rhodococcus rhodochrous]WSE22075.1 PQQ-dependent sugar dehydrogenase [Rhodococcus sp. PD04]SNV25767.1 glucose dehydrogenase [Rhodococcus rhodochrous]